MLRCMGYFCFQYFSSSNKQCEALEGESDLKVIGTETKVGIKESKDLKQDVENTRRSLFVDSCNKLSDDLRSASESVYSADEHQTNEKLPERKRRKSVDESVKETSRIGSVVSRSNDEEDLIGDFTKPYCLPLMASKHQDLKSISPQTVGSTTLPGVLYYFHQVLIKNAFILVTLCSVTTSL